MGPPKQILSWVPNWLSALKNKTTHTITIFLLDRAIDVGYTIFIHTNKRRNIKSMLTIPNFIKLMENNDYFIQKVQGETVKCITPNMFSNLIKARYKSCFISTTRICFIIIETIGLYYDNYRSSSLSFSLSFSIYKMRL